MFAVMTTYNHPPTRPWARRWQLLGAVAATLVLFVYFGPMATRPRSGARPLSIAKKNGFDAPWRGADNELTRVSTGYTPEKLAHNYGLAEAQCDELFPNLYDDILESVEARKGNHITLDELNRIPEDHKHTRVMIFDGELWIIEDYGKVPDERTTALLSSLHRALVADPERASLPNIEFIISRDDFCPPEHPLWCMTRYRPPVTNFIMPDFGFWTWPIRSIGSYTSVQRRIMEVESQYPHFSDKIPKLIWRGSPDVDRETRTRLIERSQGHSWSDVEPIHWVNDQGSPQDPPNLIEIEDHCKYQFVAHSEGNTFSGRQKYIQNCNSVIIAHHLMWIQPFHHLMVAEGPNQNYVQVNKDYSDLAEKMQYYLDHPGEAARIAANSVKTFRNRYLTPATEACYWRRLVREYARISFEPKFYDGAYSARQTPRGTPYENYIVRGNLDRKPARHWTD